MSDEDAPGTVIHFCNQTKMIPFDVEDGESSNAICSRKVIAHIFKASPMRPLCQPKPDIQRSGEFWTLRAGVKQLPAGDNVQERTPPTQNVRKKRNCQLNAKGSLLQINGA
jgi:hypothetical protein